MSTTHKLSRSDVKKQIDEIMNELAPKLELCKKYSLSQSICFEGNNSAATNVNSLNSTANIDIASYVNATESTEIFFPNVVSTNINATTGLLL